LEAVNILSEVYQKGGKSLFAPYHLHIEVLLTESVTELIRTGYCPTPALISFGHKGKVIPPTDRILYRTPHNNSLNATR